MMFLTQFSDQFVALVPGAQMVEQILNCFFFKDLLKFYDLVEKMLLSN